VLQTSKILNKSDKKITIAIIQMLCLIIQYLLYIIYYINIDSIDSNVFYGEMINHNLRQDFADHLNLNLSKKHFGGSSNTLENYNLYINEINNLQSSLKKKSDKTFKITHTLYCTMFNGKVCNVLTDQKSTTSCNICGVSPKYINDLQYIKRLKINEEHYKFSLSTHC